MKRILLFTVLIMICFAALAQTPKISYQAVLRDANNRLVTNTAVTVDVTITYGSDTYSETGLTTTTNANGLFSIAIGSVSGYEAIKWNNATIKTVVTFGTNTIVNTTAVTAVPYALNANFATDVDPNASALVAVYDRIYDDSVAVHDALRDTANAIRNAISVVPEQVNADWNATSGVAEIYNKPAVNNDTLKFTLQDGTKKIFTANQQGNTEVNIVYPGISVQELLDVVEAMTPEQKAALRDSLGISEPTTFTCGISKIADVDGHQYETVKIGTQCWTKSNLRTTHYRNGDAIAENQDASLATASFYRPSTIDAVTEHYTDSIYGMYYNAYASVDTGLCPTGWHVPTKAEWEQLTTYMSSQSDYVCGGNPDYIAKALAAIHKYVDQTEGTVYAWKNEDKSCAVGNDRGTNNASSFSAFPAGYWENTFMGYSQSARFWTSTPDNNQVWVSSLTYSEEMVNFYTGNKGQAISVRCLKDTVPAQAPEPPAFSCGNEKLQDADGNAYETVQIGTQCWTKTNLRTTKFRNGNPIPEDIDPEQSASASFSRASSADVLPDFPTYTDSTFGFYYNWYAAVDTGNSKLCPDGWHVPNDGDWMVLSSYLRANYACGNNLSNNAKAMADSLMWASNGVDCSIGNNLENNNASGFTAVPAAYLSYGSHYPMFIEALANFWTAMPSVDNLSAKYYSMYHTDKALQSYDHPKSQLLSVRCIMDDTTTIVKPVVTTDSTSAVTTISAKLHGTIINPNSIVIVKKGFEWKLSSKSYYNVKDVTGTELITTLENLIPDTQYTFKAFINYDGKTYYGDELTFKTPIKPTVTTGNATNIALTSATISGTIINPDHVILQEKGFEWKKSHGVYVYDIVEVTSGDTAMTYAFNDLIPNTKYDYKAFVKYDGKTVYGDLRSFTTPNHPEVACGTMTDADGNLYQTVKVGSQCWTKTNLRTTKYRDGSTISNQIGTTLPAYYRLNDLDKDTSVIVSQTTAPDSIFGFYYNGYASVGDKLCPAGWHVPSYDDWSDLITYLKTRPEYWCDNDNSNLAKAIASQDFWFNVVTPPITYTINNDAVARPCSPQYQGPDYLNDASYFSAIPAGAWYDNLGGNIDTVTGLGGREFDPGKDAHFWSSTTQPNSDSKGYFFRLGMVTYDVVTLAYDALKYGRSVRCIKDAAVTTGAATDVTSSSAILHGTITDPDYAQNPNAVRGFEWKASDATSYTQVITNGTTMTYQLMNLDSNTEYTYRAFLIKAEGTYYGDEVKFTTLAP